MTRQEKIDLALSLRKSGSKISVPESRLAYLAKCDVEERFVTTSTGATHFGVYRDKNVASEINPFVLNMHGGGFIKGIRKERDMPWCAALACRSGAVVLDLDYKIAPEYPYPAAVIEAYDTAAWAVAHAEELRIDVTRMAVVGHSAGGCLAVTLAMQCLKKRDFAFGFIVANYPALENYKDPITKPGMVDMPSFLAVSRAFSELYFDDRTRDGMQPLASPVYAPDEDLTGFPTIMINTCGKDPLRAEAELFGLRLARLGTRVEMKRYTESAHAFVIRGTGQWHEAEDDIVSRLNEFFRH